MRYEGGKLATPAYNQHSGLRALSFAELGFLDYAALSSAVRRLTQLNITHDDIHTMIAGSSEQYVREVKFRRERVPSFSQYPFSLPAVRNLQTLPLHPAVTYIVGENGSRKSTLLEAIAIAWGFNSEGGTKNFQFQTRASHSPLHQSLTLVKGIRRPRDGFFLRAESFFNLATDIERMDAEPAPGPPIINSYGGRSLHEQSHGESFFALMMNRFGGHSFYVLDEPQAALSPTRS